MTKFLLVVAVILFMVVGSSVAFDWQGYLTDINNVSDYSFLDEVRNIWNEDIIRDPTDGAIDWLNSEFVEVLFGFFAKSYKIGAEFVHFIVWMFDTMNVVSPWNYWYAIQPYNWGGI